MTEENLLKAFELAGFATAHILTTLHTFTTFTPLVVAFGEYGEHSKKMIRMPDSNLHEDVSDFLPEGTVGYTFLAPISINIGTLPRKTDAIGVKVFSEDKEGLLALPFVPKKLFSKFKVGNIKFLGIPEGMTDRVDGLLKAYIEGSQENIEGTKIWDAAAENF